jgi:hypothetical protein
MTPTSIAPGIFPLDEILAFHQEENRIRLVRPMAVLTDAAVAGDRQGR